MIGTGVFTTAGFQVADLGSSPAILLSWLIGGVAALCGALCYAELTAAWPRNGGDYHLLSTIYHPALGVTAGFISLVVGFAAPVAASAMAFGTYAHVVVPVGLSPRALAVGLIVVMSVVHSLDVRRAAAAQNLATAPKVALILLLGLALIVTGDLDGLTAGRQSFASAVSSPPFAVGLVFVSYAYSGWNGAAYIAGEVREPARTLPRALIVGTLMVTAAYVLLNAGFLAAAPHDALAGRIDVGFVAARALFGDITGRVVSGLIALGLVSAVGAMVMAGPRIYAAMGQDYRALGWLAPRSDGRGPAAAIWLQSGLSIIMLWTSSFDALLTYVGLTLSLMSAVTVAGVMVARRRFPNLVRPYRTLFYPLTPIIFLGAMGGMAVWAIMDKPVVAAWSLGTLLSGLLLYAAVQHTRMAHDS